MRSPLDAGAPTGTPDRPAAPPRILIVEDEPLAEVEAEKVEETLESPATGTLVEIVVPEGDTVDVRTVVARIETS